MKHIYTRFIIKPWIPIPPKPMEIIKEPIDSSVSLLEVFKGHVCYEKSTEKEKRVHREGAINNCQE